MGVRQHLVDRIVIALGIVEDRVQEQLTTLERMGRLKRFLPPQVAELVVSSGGEELLRSHRRDINTKLHITI